MGINDFAKSWAGNDAPNIIEKAKRFINPPPPLKQRLLLAQYRIKNQIAKLEHFLYRIQERDKQLFEKVVEAKMAGDELRARMYANEVAELRKIAKTVMAVQVALEQVALRIDTTIALGDVATGIAPIVGLVNELRKTLMGVMPTMAMELGEIDELLRSVVVEAGSFTGTSTFYTAASPEAKKILEEASAVAEQRMKEMFPELPAMKVGGEAAEAQT